MIYRIINALIITVSIAMLSCGNEKYTVAHSIEIDAPIEEVFNQVNNHHNRVNWSPWEEMDTNQIVNFNDIEDGKGAKYDWNGNDKVGTGSIEILESRPFSSITEKVIFTAPWESTSTIKWNFIQNGMMVRATWSIEGEMPKYMAIFMDMEKELGPDFEKGLLNLKKYCEANTNPFKMKEIIVDAQAYLTIRETISMEQKKGIYGRIFGEIASYLLNNGGVPSSKPIAIYYSTSDKKLDMELGIAVKKEYKETDRIKYKMMEARKALVVSHFGKYEDLEKTYNSIISFMGERQYSINGAPWEQYITDPSREPDTTKWETKIYFPIL